MFQQLLASDDTRVLLSSLLRPIVDAEIALQLQPATKRETAKRIKRQRTAEKKEELGHEEVDDEVCIIVYKQQPRTVLVIDADEDDDADDNSAASRAAVSQSPSPSAASLETSPHPIADSDAHVATQQTEGDVGYTAMVEENEADTAAEKEDADNADSDQPASDNGSGGNESASENDEDFTEAAKTKSG